MSAVPEAVKALLLDQRTHHCWDLWTFELTCGVTLRWTSSDIDLTVDGRLYRSEIAITRGKCKLTCGVENSTQEVTLSPGALDHEPSIAGVPMRQAIRAGLFDGAKTRLQWAYYEITRPPQLVGTIVRFTGTVGEIDGYKSKAVLTINSPLKRLDMQIPWKSYGAGCRYILGDADCGVDVSAFAVRGTVGAGSTNGTVVTDLAGDENAWAGGTVTVGGTDGVWWRRTIRASSGGVLYLKTPLPWAPVSGDPATVTPGCDKSFPALGESSQTVTIPAGLKIQGATASSWAGDRGVAMVGTSSSVTLPPGYYPEYDIKFTETIGEDGHTSYWWTRISNGMIVSNEHYYTVSITAPDTALVRVNDIPYGGQYTVTAAGIYTFSSADIGRQVVIRCATATGADRGCKRFRNIFSYGGMPLIPSPETAY